MNLADLNSLLQKIELSTQQAKLKDAEQNKGSLTAYSPSLPNMLFFMNGGVTVTGMPVSSQLYYAHVKDFIYENIEGSGSNFLTDVFSDFGFLNEEEFQKIKKSDAKMSMLYLVNAKVIRSSNSESLPFVAFSLDEIQGWTIACEQPEKNDLSLPKRSISLGNSALDVHLDS